MKDAKQMVPINKEVMSVHLFSIFLAWIELDKYGVGAYAGQTKRRRSRAPLTRTPKNKV